MARPEFNIGIGTEYIGSTRFSVIPKREPPSSLGRPASSVSTHETEHAVTAITNGTPVESVTIKPGPGYNGLTKLTRFDPIAAVAPYANGRSGTGHDVFITKLSGHNPDALSGIARSITDKKRPHIKEVARTLDEKGTLSGSDVKRIMNRVDRRISEPEAQKADVFISDPDGTERKLSNQPITPEG
ncbi:MAG: hypothetical protein ABIH84_00255, partial [bacterium]